MPPPTGPFDLIDASTYMLKERGVKDGSSPTDSFEINATVSTRKIKCLWEHRYDAVKFLLGYADTWLDGAVTKLTRLLPHKHPYLDGLFATKVLNIQGLKWEDYVGVPAGPGGGDIENKDFIRVNEFKYAELTVQYEHLPYEVVADSAIDYEHLDFPGEMQRYVEHPRNVQPSGEYLSMPGAAFRYIDPAAAGAAHNKPVPFNAGKVIPQETFQVTWYRLPEALWAPGSVLYDRVYIGETDAVGTEIVPFFGAINRKQFFGRPEGTVMLNNVIPVRQKSPLGIGHEWELTYEFIYKPSGWNWLYFFNPGTVDGSGNPTGVGVDNGWYFVGISTTHYTADAVPDNYSLYNGRDLNLLFDPDG